MGRKAYVCGITNDAFLEGALTMFASLNAHCTNHTIERVCFVTDEVSAQAYECLKNNSVIPRYVNKLKGTSSGRWSTTFQKISVFSMKEYDKIVWVDADMMITDNLDSLFAWPHMSCVKSRAPLKDNPDAFPFNSGIMVIVPRMEEYRGICSMLNTIIEEYEKEGKPLGDQNVLNAYFSHWPYQKEKHLPDEFNVFWGSVENYLDRGYSIYGEDPKIKVLHFTGKHKPWNNFQWFKMKSFIRPLRYNKRMISHETIKALKDYNSYRKRVIRSIRMVS